MKKTVRSMACILLSMAVMCSLGDMVYAVDETGGPVVINSEELEQPEQLGETEIPGGDGDIGGGGNPEPTEPDDSEEPEPDYPISDFKTLTAGYRAIKLKWSVDEGYRGDFTVYRYVDGSLKKIGTTSGHTYTVTGLTPGVKYYFRVRSNVLSEKVYATVITQKTARLTLVKSGLNRWDIRKAAGQKLYSYDTVQGACAYNGYAYMALYNRKVERVKIAKVNLRTMKVVKVSAPLKSHCHANTLTYNPRTNRVIACCGKGGRKILAYVNGTTLKQTGTRRVEMSRSFIGESYQGVAGVAYNEKYNKYFIKVRTTNNKIVKYSPDFKSRKRVKITKNIGGMMPQGVYTKGDYMYDVQSFMGRYKYNLITIRTVGGTFVGRMKLDWGSGSQKYELENLFYDNVTDKWYVSFYRANVKKSGDTDRKNYLYTLDNLW